MLHEIHRAKTTGAKHLSDGYGYSIDFTSVDEDSSQAIKDLFNRLVSRP